MQLFFNLFKKLHILLILINSKFDNLLVIKEEIIMFRVSEKWFCIKKFIRRITNFVSYIGHLRWHFYFCDNTFQALSVFFDLVFIERRSKMLNKVKTKALISVGAVAATSFILMMGYTVGQHLLLNKIAKKSNWLQLNL